MSVEKLNKKINLYKKLAKIPFCKNKALNKIKKYQDKINIILKNLDAYTENAFIYSKIELDLLNAKLDLNNKNYNKKKILVIGTLVNFDNSELPKYLYSNNILKNLDYSKTLVHFFDTKTLCLYEIHNERYLPVENYRNLLCRIQFKNLNTSLYDISFQVIAEPNCELPAYKSLISYAYVVSDFSDTDFIADNFDAVILPRNNDIKYSLPCFIEPVNINTNSINNILNCENRRLGCIAHVSDAIKLLNFLKQNKITMKDFELEICYYTSNSSFQIPPTQTEAKDLSLINTFRIDGVKITKSNIYQFKSEIASRFQNWSGVIYLNDAEDYINNPRLALASQRCAFIPSAYNYDKISGAYCYSSFEELIEKIFEFANSDVYFEKYTPTEKPFSKYLECIDTSCANLYAKYQYLNNNNIYKFNKKIIAVPANDAGFCSVLNKQVSLMASAHENEYYIPDWRISVLSNNIKKYYKLSRFSSFCYGKRSDGNLFLRFFESPYKDIPNELYESDILYKVADDNIDILDYNFDDEPFLTYIYPYNLYDNEKYFSEFRKKYYETYKKHFKLLPHIQSQIDSYAQKLENKFSIGLQIRCSGHSLELNSDDEVNFKTNIKLISKILKENNIDINSGDWVLFIATDNDVALNYFSEKFPNNIYYQKDVSRLSVEQENEYLSVKKRKRKNVYGYELQHRKALSEETRDIKLAEEIIIDIHLLAKCNYFIYKSSNVSTAVSYLNPDLKMVYAKEDK